MKTLLRRKVLIFIVFIVLCAFLIPFEIHTDKTFWGKVLDVGHIPMFFLIATLIQRAFTLKGDSKTSATTKSATFALLAAICIEVIQPLAGRSFELNDILNGAFGIFLACIAVFAKDCKRKAISFLLFGFIAGLILGWASMPAFNAYATLKWRHEMFPVLALFESPLEKTLWKKITDDTEIDFGRFDNCEGNFCLKLLTAAQGWSGVEYRAECLDWTGFKFLSLTIYSEEEFDLNLRIDDDGDVTNYEDRYNSKIKLSKGQNLVTLPISQIEKAGGARTLNIKCISRILLFVSSQSSSQTIFLANMQLL